MKKKIYLVQPTYRDREGLLLKAGPSLFTHSLAIPALSAAIPPDWEKEACLEYFEDVNLDTDAPVVAMSCLGYDLFRGRELAEIFRKRGKIVIFGGCASELWKDLITSVADSVVSGNPGRAAVARILADAEGGALAPEYHCEIDLDYPFDYSVLARRNIARRISFLPAVASAGCSYRCSFCCTAAKFKGRYHARSLDAVMADLRTLKTLTRHFVFVDSNFYVDRGHIARLAERMIAEQLGLTWSTECSIDVGDDPEILGLLRRAGCRALLIGIETLAQRNLSRMQKPFAVEHYRDQIRRIQKTGIIVAGFFIFGFDGDTRSTVDEFCEFVRELNIAVPFFNFLCPVPGTRFFEQMKKEGRLLADGEDAYLRQNVIYGVPTHRCLFRPEQMTPREAELAFVELRERVSTFPAILSRTMRQAPANVPAVLLLNLAVRRETLAVARAVRGDGRPPSNGDGNHGFHRGADSPVPDPSSLAPSRVALTANFVNRTSAVQPGGLDHPVIGGASDAKGKLAGGVWIKEVTSVRELRQFVLFPFSLYKRHPCWVPPLIFDELHTLRRDQNPAFAHCEARYWLAYRDGRIAGRIAGIINHKYVEKWGTRYARFGWVDFVDDAEVVSALFGTVEQWAVARGMTGIHGPLGFTDMDREGMLVDGFDELGTLATIYNHRYYPGHLESLGYVKDVDWLEFEIKIPAQVPEKAGRVEQIVKSKLGVRALEAKTARQILPYTRELFAVLNTAFAPLYAFVPLTDRQIDTYVKQYFSFIHPDFTKILLDANGKVAGFVVGIPSLSRALQKARGRLFPFGFVHLLAALRKPRTIDLYVGAVRPDLQGKGADALLMTEMTRSAIARGIVSAESNVELEENTKVQNHWKYYDARQHKRRRCYIKKTLRG